MRIQLLHPPAFLNPTALTALRPSLPLGMAYIAAAIREAGHEVSIIDAVGEAPETIVATGRVARLGLATDAIVARIDPQTEVLGLSAMFTYQWPVVQEILAAVHAARPDLLLVGGGEHFTGLPDESLTDSAIHICVLGEGEETIVELLDRYQRHRRAPRPPPRPGAAPDAKPSGGPPAPSSGDDGGEHPGAPRSTAPVDPGAEVARWAEGLAGTAWLKDGRVHHEPRRDRIRELDAIAPPAWDLFDVRGYDDHRLVNGVRAGRTMPVLATRGCPYRCAYCSSPNAWTQRWYARDPTLVVDEIERWVETYGATNFPFQDLTAILKRKWIVRFCNELIERELDITWQLPTGTRCEVVDAEVSELLRRSGSLQVNFAPESGSAAVRKKVSKNMQEESLFNAVRAAVGAGLNVTCFFVLGFPRDQVSDFKETVRWVRKLAKLGVDDVAVGFFFPIPGTRFYNELKADGKLELNEDLVLAPIFVHDRWLTEDRNYSGSLGAATLTWWRYRIVLAFYTRAILLNPRRWLRIARNFLSGREDSKFDSFLQILKERFFTRRAART